jgi:hypothetical protein
MIKTILFCLFTISLCVSNELSYGDSTQKCSVDDEKKIPRYAIQIFSVKNNKNTNKILKKLPSKLKKDTHLYRVGEYIAIRYASAKNSKELEPYLEKFYEVGFKDAYIVKTTKWHMRTSILDINKTITEDTNQSLVKDIENQNVKKQLDIKIKKNHVSKYIRTNIVKKADKAYKTGDESSAILYYEMLLNSGYSTKKIKNNLCYLYGKRGAWFEAKDLIEKEKFAFKFLYAYAYGAMQTNQDDFFKDLSEYIMLDKSGRLSLISGYYYEKKAKLDKANSFYKMAYDKNPSDVYNMFAYARSLDMMHNTNDALNLYKKIIIKINKNHKNYAKVRQRILELEQGGYLK